jgi:hypothetical protein
LGKATRKVIEMKWLNQTVLALLLTSVSAQLSFTQDRFGGIEIGAKGIKHAVIEVDGSTIKTLSLKSDVANVNVARLKELKFEKWRVEEVAEWVELIKMAMIDELELHPDRIRVVASSGVPGFATNFKELSDTINAKTALNLERVSANEEAALTNLALIPGNARLTTMVLDVGSGNIKGGAFQDQTGALEGFVGIDAPLGTGSLAQRALEESGLSKADFASTVKQIAETSIGDRLKTLRRAYPVLDERNRVLFSGGAVWAFVTFTKPESANDPFPTIAMGDIVKYRQLLERNFPNYPVVTFDHVTDVSARSSAQADHDRIVGQGGSNPIFSPEELMAGAVILEQIAISMEFQKREVLFDRKSMTAWITAIITPEELRPVLSESLGRSLPDKLDLANSMTEQPSQGSAGDSKSGQISKSRSTDNEIANAVNKSGSTSNKTPSSGLSETEKPQQVTEGSQLPTGYRSPIQSGLRTESNCLPMSCGQYYGWTQVCWYEQDYRQFQGCYRSYCCARYIHCKGWRPVVRWRRFPVNHDCQFYNYGCVSGIINSHDVVVSDTPSLSPFAKTSRVQKASCSAPNKIVQDPTVLREWIDYRGEAIPEKLRAILIANGHVVFESESYRIFAYPLVGLADCEKRSLNSLPNSLAKFRMVFDDTGSHSAQLILVKSDFASAWYLNEHARLINVPLNRLSQSEVAHIGAMQKEREIISLALISFSGN